MDAATAIEMDAPEIEAFLRRQGTGVLSFAREDEAYSIPVSYGYEPESGALYFRLGFADGSEKRAFLAATERAAFVVYDGVGDVWRSAIARGRLETVPDDDLDASVVRGLQRADLPLVAMFDRPEAELSFSIVRLVVDELTGRRTPAADPTA